MERSVESDASSCFISPCGSVKCHPCERRAESRIEPGSRLLRLLAGEWDSTADLSGATPVVSRVRAADWRLTGEVGLLSGTGAFGSVILEAVRLRHLDFLVIGLEHPTPAQWDSSIGHLALHVFSLCTASFLAAMEGYLYIEDLFLETAFRSRSIVSG